MVDNRTRRRTEREMTRLVENLVRREENGRGGLSNRQVRVLNEHRRLWNTLNPTDRWPGSNSNSNSNRTRRSPRTRSEMRRVRLPSRSPSRSPSNSNRTRRAPSRSPSRSRSSPSSSSRGSNSNSSNSNSNYSISTPYAYQWKVVKLNNPPKEDATLNNFNNKDAKAVKVSWTLNGKKFSDYYTPRTVTGLMYTFEGRPKPGEIPNRKIQSAMQRLKSSSTDPNKVVFEHPKTRANVRKKNLEFVRLEKRTNKNKAATKIQAAYRGGRERQKTLNRAKRTAALITKKRRRN